MIAPTPFFDRFWSKVDKSDLGGCWLWTGHTVDGYGRIRLGTRERDPHAYAHRVAYEFLVGPVPAGLQLDHLCRVRHCVNPDHLEPVTNRENTVRGLGPELTRARQAAITHCKNGHPLIGENMRHATSHGVTRRICRTCAAQHMKKYRARLRERVA